MPEKKEKEIVKAVAEIEPSSSSSGWLPSVDLSDLPSEVQEKIEEMKEAVAAEFRGKMQSAHSKIQKLVQLKNNVGACITEAVDNGKKAVDAFLQEQISNVLDTVLDFVKLLVTEQLKDSLPDSAVNIFMKKTWPGIATNVVEATTDAFKLEVDEEDEEDAPPPPSKKSGWCCGGGAPESNADEEAARDSLTEQVVNLKKGLLKTVTDLPKSVPLIRDLIDATAGKEEPDMGLAKKKGKKSSGGKKKKAAPAAADTEEEDVPEEMQETETSDRCAAPGASRPSRKRRPRVARRMGSDFDAAAATHARSDRDRADDNHAGRDHADRDHTDLSRGAGRGVYLDHGPPRGRRGAARAAGLTDDALAEALVFEMLAAGGEGLFAGGGEGPFGGPSLGCRGPAAPGRVRRA